MSQIIDAFNINGYNSKYLPGIITEYYEKGELTNNLGKLSNKEIINIMYELVIALRNIHRIGVVHRDIKTANIFLDKNNKAYIGDFGLAKFGDEGEVGSGTQTYIPADIYRKKSYSRKKLDLYALLLCFISMIEKLQVVTSNNELSIRLGHRNYMKYKDMRKIRDFDRKYVNGIYDIFDKVFINKNYDILDWDKFLETDFWENLEKKYKEINNK